MSVLTLGRVEFRAGRLIRAVDLAARDADRRYRLDLHQALQHGPGIVHGLNLEIADTRLQIAAGLALDAYGRSLRLVEDVMLALPQNAIDVWLTAVETAALPRRRGRIEICNDRQGRVRETATVVIRPRELPGAVAFSDDVCGAVFPPPAESEFPAEVYLGSLRRRGTDPKLWVDQTLAHAGAKAESITSGSGGVSVLLGYGPAAVAPRFAVSIGDAEPRLEVDFTRKATIRGSVAAKSVRTPRIRFGRAAPPADHARPWSLARVAVPQPNGPPREALRLEIENPDGKGDPANYRLEVGDSKAAAPLVVSGNGNVSASHLDVFRDKDRQALGELVRAPIPPDPGDPRFAAAAGEALIKGMGAALERSFVQGEVIDTEGLPVLDAEIALLGLGLKQPVDKQGRFVFPRVGWPGQVVFTHASAAGSKPRVVPGVVGSALRIVLGVSHE